MTELSNTGYRRGLIRLFVIVFLVILPGTSSAAESIDVSGPLSLKSGKTLPEHWQLETFPFIANRTNYEIVIDKLYGPVIKAEVSGGVAGLVRKLSVKPEDYPLLSWSWKVSNVFTSASIRDKHGDDCPARLFISFGTNHIRGGIPEGTLSYVWASKEPVGTVAASPYLDDVTIIVVTSGDKDVGTWQAVERNIVDDYFKVYGKKPGTIRAITLMTDGDNTAGKATAWYGAIKLNQLRNK